MIQAGIFASLVEVADDRVGEVFGDDQDQADPHVEDAVHLGLVDRAQPLQPGEDLGDRPRPAAEADGAALGKDARRVIDQAAAGDVGDAVHDPLDPVVAVDRLDGPHVDPRGLEQLVGHGPAQLVDEGVGRQAGVLEDDLPRQAVAVGMQARAGQADDLVAGADVAAVEDVLPLDDPDAEPGQVVFARPCRSRAGSPSRRPAGRTRPRCSRR